MLPDFNRDVPVSRPVKFSDILLLVLRGIILTVIAYALAKSLEVSRFWVVIIAAMVQSASWILGYQRLSGKRGWDSLQVRFAAVGGRILWSSAAGAIALMVFTATIGTILNGLGIRLVLPSDDLLKNLTSDPRGLPVVFLLVVIVAPLAEELMFRGMLLDWLRQKMTAWLAIVLISLFFALLHNNSFGSGAIGWLQLGDRFLIGVGASFLAVRYRSLRPSFVLHATINVVAVFASALASHLQGA